MKINGNSLNAVSAYIHTSSENTKRKAAANSEKKSMDTVEFSESAKAAAERNSAAKQKRQDAVRAVRDSASPERIAALKSSVNSGNYNISDEAVADAILNG